MHETFVLATDLWRVLAPAYPDTVQRQRHFKLSHSVCECERHGKVD